MTEIATNEPQVFTAGDTVKWKRQLSDYKASDGWTLKYHFINADDKQSVTAAADGDDHLVTISTTDSDAFSAGIYHWQAFVEKGSERYQVDTGTIEVKPNFADSGLTTYDARSHVRKVLDAIEAVIENRASLDQKSYTIQGRTLERTPVEDLLKFRKEYQAELKRIEQAERIRNGYGGSGKVLVRF